MRTALLYLLLVGVPLVGVTAILYVGAGLEAPRAVSGLWTLALAAGPAPACVAGDGDDDPMLRISQSGPRLEVRLVGVGGERIDLRGRLQGDHLLARSRLLLLPGCVHPGSLLLDARLETEEDARLLHGVLTGEGCACGAVSFVAGPMEAEE